MEKMFEPCAEGPYSVDEEHSAPAFFLLMETPADDALSSQKRRDRGRDMFFGTAGSLLAHCLLGLSFLLVLQHLQPLRPARSPVCNVFLTSFGKAGFGGGPADCVGSGPAGHPAEEDFAAPTAPPPASPATCDLEPVPAKEKPRKQVTVQPKARPKPRPERPAAGPVETLATSSPKSGPENATGDEGAARGDNAAAGTGGQGDSRAGALPGAGSGEGPFEAAAVDKAPQVLAKTEPVYPQKARNLGIGGRVVLKFLVEPSGQVSHPGVLEAHPRGYFEQSALEAVRRWRFKPGYLNGRAVATWLTLPVQFRLVEDD